jgi:hypothetical protein
MATMVQLKQIMTNTQKQLDILLAQVNKIEQQEMAIRKQNITANGAARAKNEAQLTALSQQKLKITGMPIAAGAPAIQTEDGESGAVAMAPASAAVTTSSAGNVSSMGGSGNYPMRWGTDKKSSKLNVMQRVKQTESIYTFVDNLGSDE